jgi:GNAT superfamily N-acetyltransferase
VTRAANPSQYPSPTQRPGSAAMSQPGDVEIRRVPFGSPDARHLLGLADEYNTLLYGHADESPLDPEEFAPESGGLFLIAYRDHLPIAGGGFRRSQPPAPDGVAEVKRMYVVEHERRQGLARRILSALEDLAKGYGYPMVILDTGRKQDAAHRLYESCGYHQIPGFTIYRDVPGNRAYAKDLR